MATQVNLPGFGAGEARGDSSKTLTVFLLQFGEFSVLQKDNSSRPHHNNNKHNLKCSPVRREHKQKPPAPVRPKRNPLEPDRVRT
jgi:hypothetical protein